MLALFPDGSSNDSDAAEEEEEAEECSEEEEDDDEPVVVKKDRPFNAGLPPHVRPMNVGRSVNISNVFPAGKEARR